MAQAEGVAAQQMEKAEQAKYLTNQQTNKPETNKPTKEAKTAEGVNSWRSSKATWTENLSICQHWNKQHIFHIDLSNLMRNILPCFFANAKLALNSVLTA